MKAADLKLLALRPEQLTLVRFEAHRLENLQLPKLRLSNILGSNEGL